MTTSFTHPIPSSILKHITPGFGWALLGTHLHRWMVAHGDPDFTDEALCGIYAHEDQLSEQWDDQPCCPRCLAVDIDQHRRHELLHLFFGTRQLAHGAWFLWERLYERWQTMPTDPHWYPTQRGLSEMTGAAKSTLQVWQRQLVAVGMLRRPVGGTPCLCFPTFPADWTIDDGAPPLDPIVPPKNGWIVVLTMTDGRCVIDVTTDPTAWYDAWLRVLPTLPIQRLVLPTDDAAWATAYIHASFAPFHRKGHWYAPPTEMLLPLFSLTRLDATERTTL